MAARKTTFYYAFLVLPADQRRAIIAVWDFCRAVDDAVDEDGELVLMPGRQAVVFWREELARCYGNETPTTPQGLGLKPFIAAFNLPRQAFDDVIDGVAMDLDKTRYETFDDLLEYCRRVASAVGMICIQIFRCTHPKSREYALHLGIALQLTNILRDVKGDLARGRVYLPLEDLRAAGCTVEDLMAGRPSAPVRRAMQIVATRAHHSYQQALDARPDEERRRLVAAEIMRAVYFATLQRIERAGFDVFGSRPRIPKPQQVFIALRQWLLPF